MNDRLRLLLTKVVVVAAFVCTASTARGAEQVQPGPGGPPPIVSPAPAAPPIAPSATATSSVALAPPAEDPRTLWERGDSMRSTGQLLTIIGVVFTAGGTVLLYTGLVALDEDPHSGAAVANISIGALALALGVSGLGLGIPFWAIGARRVDRAEEMGYAPPD